MNKLPADFQQKLDEYKEVFLASRNFAFNTRKNYLVDITQLLDFLASKGITELQRVGLRDLRLWMAELDRKGRTGTTGARKASSVKSFFGFLKADEHIQNNIAEQLPLPEKETKIRRVLSTEEYKRLELAVANEPKIAAIIEILLQTGIRLSELVNLNIDDVRLPVKITKDEDGAGALLIQGGKRRKDRIVPLNYKACRAVKAWLQARPQVQTNALIISKFANSSNNGRITPGGVQKLVGKRFKEVGIQNASIHAFRHTCATHMLVNGAKVTSIRDMLGHKDLSTTSIYLSLMQEQMAKDAQNCAL
ncbi:MAG: tyrosine-type recombinase/integrase [Candidatus Levybacteria bacterium]|nr:tyrosine-type recombinase/integrase [Candidatus Levybacteria bacterium]